VVERRSLSGTVVAGVASGSHTLTHQADGAELSVQEQLSGGNPSSRFSFLEYRFTVDVAPGGRIELLVRGRRTASSDGDDFRFEWSTNGTTFTPVPMDPLPVGAAGIRVGDLPPTLSGVVTLRILDTDRTPGQQALDTVLIDSLVVRSISP
jgi:hypothetical protein